MLILGIHSGWQDAGAALFEDYHPLAAVPLSRLTGVARDGGRVPVEAVLECLAIAGARHTDIDGVALSPGMFPGRYFTGLSLGGRVRRGLRALIGRETPASLAEASRRTPGRGIDTLLDTAALLGDLGLNRNIPVRYYTRHAAHALLPLFQTAWQDALLFTADAGGDGPPYGAQLLKHGRLADIHGEDIHGEDGAVRPDGLGHLVALAVDGLGLPDPAALFALAAYGEPLLAQALLSHVAVDADGRIRTDFSADGGAARWLRGLAEGHAPAAVAASLLKAVEDSLVQALGRLMQRHGTAHLAMGGELLADPRLLCRLAVRLSPQGLAVHPLGGEGGLPLGGVLQFLLARDGLAAWLRQRRPFPAIPAGRDYGADIDPVLGNGGCRLVSQDAVQASAALLNAGKSFGLYGRQAFGFQGGPGRTVVFAGDRAGMAGAVNSRLDRPDIMPPVLYARHGEAADFFEAAPPVLPGGAVLPAPLAARWRARLPAALAPDFLCQVHPVDPATEPQMSAVLEAYAALSGLPALLGLPMQIGGGAPLDAPGDALRLLREDRVDYIATDNAVWERG